MRLTLNTYNKMAERQELVEKHLYSSREWKRAELAKKRREMKENWFEYNSNTNFEIVIFMPATPGSELKKRYKRSLIGQE